MSAKTCAYPHNAEALDVTVAAYDLEAGGGKPQIGEIGILEADIRFVDLAVITRNSVAQVMNAD